MKKQNLQILLVAIFIVLILITLFTKYIGSTDTKSFTSVAKYFAGSYKADIRSSHSYLWGFINSPLVYLTKSFIGFKILNLIVLLALIYSVYYISGKNEKALWLILLSPIIWYMAPWVNSIQISSLAFLWSYYFMKSYDKNDKFKEAILAGIFFGIGITFWHGLAFFGLFYLVFFFYNKKAYNALLCSLGIFIGLLPLFLLDFYLFGFPFHSLMKNVFGTISNLLRMGVYSKDQTVSKSFFALISIFLFIPIYFWKLYKKEQFKKNYKIMLFLTISIIIILYNPQIRYLILIVPIMILILVEKINKKQFRVLILISLIMSFIVIIPYQIQVKYDTNGEEFKSFLANIFSLELKERFGDLVRQDLSEISQQYPNKVFVVGNHPDTYQHLADYYWENNIEEFVSIQDYNLYLKNTSVLVERTFKSSPKRISGRREIWITGGIGRPEENTDYENLDYGLAFEEQLDLEKFNLVKRYKTLNLFEKQ